MAKIEFIARAFDQYSIAGCFWKYVGASFNYLDAPLHSNACYSAFNDLKHVLWAYDFGNELPF